MSYPIGPGLKVVFVIALVCGRTWTQKVGGGFIHIWETINRHFFSDAN